MPTRIVLYPALVTALVVAACAAFEPGDLPPTAPPAELATESVPTEPAVESAELEVYLVDNPAQEGLTDVFSRNLKSGEVTYLASLENVYGGHYHGQELHRGSLYVIRRLGEPSTDEDWTDELWRYGPDGQGALLFSGQAIDFRTAPDESYSAIAYSVDTEAGSAFRLAFVGPDGGLAHGINEVLFNPGYAFQPLEWTGDGGQFWAALQAGPRPMAFLRITPGSWKLEVFDLTALSLGEYDLNTQTARLAFSDYPTMFDADSAAQFAQSQTTVTLWVLDLNSNQMQTIATTTGRPFGPTWLSATTLEYNHPEEEGRIFTILE